MSFIPMLGCLSFKGMQTLQHFGSPADHPHHSVYPVIGMEYENDEALVRDMLQATEKLRQRPLDSLARYSNEIAVLHDSFRYMWSSLNTEAGMPRRLEHVPPQNTTQRRLQAPAPLSSYDILTEEFDIDDMLSDRELIQDDKTNTDLMLQPNPKPEGQGCSTPEFVKLVEAVLISGLECISPFYDTILEFGPDHEKWRSEDQRSKHLQPILTLQRKKPSRQIVVSDRILLIGAAMSLAKDFREFERDHGWTPKQDQLIERILRDDDPASQKLGKHLQNFIAIHDTVNINRDKLDAGLRLGTKLYVVDAISHSLNLGHSLTLIIGFECIKLSRLNYRAFSSFGPIIKANPHIYNQLARLSKTFDEWWLRFHVTYQQRNSTYGRAYQARPGVNPSLPDNVYRASSELSSQSEGRLSRTSASEHASLASRHGSYIVGGPEALANQQHSPLRPGSSTQPQPQPEPSFSSPDYNQPRDSPFQGNMASPFGFTQGPGAGMYAWDSVPPNYTGPASNLAMNQDAMSWTASQGYDQYHGGQGGQGGHYQ